MLPIVLALVVFFAFMIFLSKDAIGKGALQVTSIPQSTVYLNGKLVGKTPLCECDPKNMLPTGDYTIRLVPLDSSAGDPFEQKISINKAVLTVVDRTFGPGATSQGAVISLTPQDSKSTAGIYIASFPDVAQVTLDDNTTGTTPYRLANTTESDHDLMISKTGFKDKHVRIHTVKGYTLSVIAFLGIDTSAIASSAASLPTPVASPTGELKQKVVILDTPTGFLRVHSDATITSTEIAQVKPQQVFDLQDEQVGWFEIKLIDGKLGWISSQYAKKQ